MAKAYSEYKAAHRRVVLVKGPAKHKACAFCGTFAAEWAYNHLDPEEIYRDGYLWSENTEFYTPLCTRDHRAYDRAFRQHGKAVLPAVADALREAGRDRYADEVRDFVNSQNHKAWQTRETTLGDQRVKSPEVPAEQVRETDARISAAYASSYEG
ncbi:hypothetical protein [Streptomyces sp. NPDC005336]|uniref:hypothetical protein n=1 Tax=Streptomyces sp. NPDC005336 TaxID=3157035 RepID=UPI0033B02C27